MLCTILLAPGTDAGPGADLAVNRQLGFRVPASQNGGYAKRPHTRVESICLDVASHAVGERRGGDRGLVEIAP